MKATKKQQDWQPCTFGDVLKERVEGGSQDDELLSVTNSRGIIRQSESNKRDTSNTDKSKYKRVHVDDIVYNTMRMWQGVSGRSSYNGIVSPAYTVCTPVAGNDSRCLAALLKHPLNVNLFRRYSQGLVDDTLSLKYDVFAQLPLLLPANEEQPRIARVLNELEAAIQHSEELIAKLKQVRAGLIHDLLTRGVNEHGEVRDIINRPELFKKSIFGLIPNNWDVLELDQLILSAIDGPFGSNLKTEHYIKQPEVRVVRLQNIGEGYFDDTDRVYISYNYATRLSRYEVLPNDLLVASLGDDKNLIARACLFPDNAHPGIIKADCFRLRLNPQLAIHSYIMHTLNCPSTRKDVRALGQGVTRDRINLTTLKRIRVPVPEVIEQERIIDYLVGSLNQIFNEEKALIKLQKLRQGLHNDLLTGEVKITVDEQLEV